MVCTPLTIQTGEFITVNQATWNNVNESPVPGKTATYSRIIAWRGSGSSIALVHA